MLFQYKAIIHTQDKFVCLPLRIPEVKPESYCNTIAKTLILHPAPYDSPERREEGGEKLHGKSRQLQYC